MLTCNTIRQSAHLDLFDVHFGKAVDRRPSGTAHPLPVEVDGAGLKRIAAKNWNSYSSKYSPSFNSMPGHSLTCNRTLPFAPHIFSQKTRLHSQLNKVRLFMIVFGMYSTTIWSLRCLLFHLLFRMGLDWCSSHFSQGNRLILLFIFGPVKQQMIAVKLTVPTSLFPMIFFIKDTLLTPRSDFV